MNNLRTCVVEITIYPHKKARQCEKIEPKTETHKGYFHTWGSESYVTNGYLVGTTAGQMSTLYGVVEYEDGSVHRVPPECITFTDRKIGMCEFCKGIKTEEDFDTEKPYLYFGKWNNNEEAAFHIDLPSDDGMRHSVDNVLYCPYCGRKL